jgi:hypothetical protein
MPGRAAVSAQAPPRSRGGACQPALPTRSRSNAPARQPGRPKSCSDRRHQRTAMITRSTQTARQSRVPSPHLHGRRSFPQETNGKGQEKKSERAGHVNAHPPAFCPGRRSSCCSSGGRSAWRASMILPRSGFPPGAPSPWSMRLSRDIEAQTSSGSIP